MANVFKVFVFQQRHDMLEDHGPVGIIDRSVTVVEILPQLPTRLWMELDIISFHFPLAGEHLDERADSASRKCSMWFGHTLVPHNI
jgi:hypothetical protein